MELFNIFKKDEKPAIKNEFMTVLMHRLAVEVAMTQDKQLIDALLSNRFNEVQKIAQKVIDNFSKSGLPLEYLGTVHSTFLDEFLQQLKQAR